MPTLLEAIGHTPLVPLLRLGQGLPVPVLAKCEHLNPGGSVKDRIALAIVQDAESKGLLHPGATLIEATAGNTGLGLAIVAAGKGYQLVCVLPEKMAVEKREALRSLGAQVIVTPNVPPSHPEHFQAVARRLAQQRGWFLTDQFRHPANLLAHQTGTGPEILAQTQGNLGAFVAGAGTGGTLTGVARCLKPAVPGVRVVLADPLGSALAGLVRDGRPGPDASYRVEGIGSSVVPENLDLTVLDDAETVTDEESFQMTRRLWREEGLLVGGSSGTAVVAALRVAAKGLVQGPVVVLLPDSWDRYRGLEWTKA